MARDKQKTPSNQPQGKVQGEGNYEAARRYDEKLREHVQQHDVDQEARDAEPSSEGEKRELERAEEKGRGRAKEEDRLLDDPESIDTPGEGKSAPR